MRRRRVLSTFAAGSAGGLAGCVSSDSGGHSGEDTSDGSDGGSGGEDTTDEWPSDPYADYETTTIEVRTADGDSLGTVLAVIADTREKRYLGLSNATGLSEDGGMLFTYDAPQEGLTYVMREMEFGIDIVYADADGAITRIHNAPEPGTDEDGSEQRYSGSGQYVLEVSYKWTDRNDVAAGDVLAFDAS